MILSLVIEIAMPAPAVSRGVQLAGGRVLHEDALALDPAVYADAAQIHSGTGSVRQR